MSRLFLGLIALSSISVCASLGAQSDYKEMVGKYSFVSHNVVDPLPGEARNRVALFIEGSAAKEIYEKIPSPTVVGQCSAELVFKTAGDLQCAFDREHKDYTCALGVNLVNGKTVAAGVC